MRKPPVKHTCPDIDGIIFDIEAIITDLRSLEVSENRDILDDSCNELEGLVSGPRCVLEELRDSNSALRTWGEELAEELEEAEKKISDLESELHDLNERIEGLEEQLTLEISSKEN
jgi:predicted  nucleic acid-binding Zn-ribbon protein